MNGFAYEIIAKNVYFMRKILFLDFDGVLHPTHCKQGDEFSRLHLFEVLFLDSFCEIVVSSSWRFHHSINELKKN
jgi:hypothetical protein